jgi:hypothetical protein
VKAIDVVVNHHPQRAQVDLEVGGRGVEQLTPSATRPSF